MSWLCHVKNLRTTINANLIFHKHEVRTVTTTIKAWNGDLDIEGRSSVGKGKEIKHKTK